MRPIASAKGSRAQNAPICRRGRRQLEFVGRLARQSLLVREKGDLEARIARSRAAPFAFWPIRRARAVAPRESPGGRARRVAVPRHDICATSVESVRTECDDVVIRVDLAREGELRSERVLDIADMRRSAASPQTDACSLLRPAYLARHASRYPVRGRQTGSTYVLPLRASIAPAGGRQQCPKCPH